MTLLTRRTTLSALASALTLPVIGSGAGIGIGAAQAQATSDAGTAPTLPATPPTVHEVRMLDRSPVDPNQRNVFWPPVVRIRPGDIVRFVPTDGGHTPESIPTMLPPGAAPFEGRRGEPLEVRFTVDGTYGVICDAHARRGMIGFVLVGNHSVNFAAVQAAAPALRGDRTVEAALGYLTEISAGLH